MGAVETEDRIRTVEAEINYLSPGSFINRRFVSPGLEHNTGSYEAHRMPVSDGRPIKDRFSLDTHGFVLASHRSAVADFRDKAQVDGVYPGEVIEAVKALTGATAVAPMGWMGRTSGDLSKHRHQTAGYSHQGGLQPPAGEAHVDMTPDRADRLAQMLYERCFPDGKGFSRFVASSLWRTFSEPPQDWPLAVCDARTVGPDEGVANTMIVVDALPDETAMLAPMPDEGSKPAAAVFRYSPAHRWWYFSNMTRDEVLMFKFHDSDRSKAWRTPHTAFHDPSFPGARVRESVEFRTVAYFE